MVWGAGKGSSREVSQGVVLQGVAWICLPALSQRSPSYLYLLEEQQWGYEHRWHFFGPLPFEDGLGHSPHGILAPRRTPPTLAVQMVSRLLGKRGPLSTQKSRPGQRSQQGTSQRDPQVVWGLVPEWTVREVSAYLHMFICTKHICGVITYSHNILPLQVILSDTTLLQAQVGPPGLHPRTMRPPTALGAQPAVI